MIVIVEEEEEERGGGGDGEREKDVRGWRREVIVGWRWFGHVLAQVRREEEEQSEEEI